MIRLRRIPTRIPFSRLYEVEVDGDRRVTRAPLEVLEPRLGVGDAWSFIVEADRQWSRGSHEWAVEFEAAPGPTPSHDIR